MPGIVDNILIFQKLTSYAAPQIFQVINEEPAQIVAAILARMVPKKAKEVLREFPTEAQKDIAYRIARGTPVPPEILQTVALSINEKLEVFDERSGLDLNGTEKLAKIMNLMGPSASKELMQNLHDRDPDMASKVKDRMFTFAEIVKVNDDGLRKAMTDIPNSLLALAIKGTEEAMKQKFLKNISDNRRKILKAEFDSLGKRRRSEVDTAQKKVLEILKKYVETGELYIKDRREDDEWV